MMNYLQWEADKKSSKKKSDSIKKIRDNANSVISHQDTLLRYCSFFSGAKEYLLNKFPNVDIGNVPIYVAPYEIIDKFGFSGCGGCYIKPLRLILVKDKILSNGYKSRFERILSSQCELKVDIEDVVVHELIHAISHKIRRSSNQFTHMEEEFVYTNCVEFYLKKGMSKEDIVLYNFLPFCINDILNSRSDMIKVLRPIGVSIKDFKNKNKRDKIKLFNTYAEELVEIIKTKAIDRGHNMINIYNARSDQTKIEHIHTKNKVSLRFSSLDLD